MIREAQMVAITLSQIKEVNGQAKNKWSLDSNKPQNKQAGEISGETLFCLTRVDNLSRAANQQMNPCLGIILLNHIKWNHGTLGFLGMMKFQVEAR